MAVKVLEEALSVQSILSHELSEIIEYSLHVCSLSLICFSSSVYDVGASVTNLSIKLLFKSLFGEYLIDCINKLSPFDVGSFLRSFEGCAEIVEFLGGNRNFSHVETNSKLWGSDVARPESIEISKEFTNSDSLLTACLSDSGKHIVNISRCVTYNFCFANTGLSFWEVVKAMIEVSTNSKQLLFVINVFCEVYIVHLINISFVHVTPQKHLHLVSRRSDAKQIKNSQELGLCNMAILCDVKVLEDRLKMNALILHCCSVFL